MSIAKHAVSLWRSALDGAGSLFSKAVVLPPVADQGQLRALLPQCVAKDDPVILEIGCNDGTDTFWLRDLFGNATIHCFEPDPRAVKRFRRKVGDRPRIRLHETALSDREGSVVFHQSGGDPQTEYSKEMPEGWDLSGSIRPPKRHLAEYPWCRFDRSIEVPTTTLDAWCSANGVSAIDFIWMDVQGAEIDVFRGGRRALRSTRYLFTEYDNTEMYAGQYPLPRLLRFLRTFEIVALYPNDVLLKNRRLG